MAFEKSVFDRQTLSMDNEDFYQNVFCVCLGMNVPVSPEPKESSLFFSNCISDLLSSCSCPANVTFFFQCAFKAVSL